MRDFTGGRGRSNTSAGIPFESEPAIAVLTSYAFGPYGDVAAGQAMQRVLLTATAEGLAASFLSQLIEVERAREELRRLIGGPRGPQVVLRIGRGWPVSATPRRSVDDLPLVPARPRPGPYDRRRAGGGNARHGPEPSRPSQVGPAIRTAAGAPGTSDGR